MNLCMCTDFWTNKLVSYTQKEGNRGIEEGGQHMKGYYNNSGYMGYVEGSWVLFASESDYRDYMED